TMLLVTHDVDEAIYMSDRIVIMSPRPGRIERVLDITLPRPRNRTSPEFLRMRGQILELLHFAAHAGPQNPDFKTSNGAVRGSPAIPDEIARPAPVASAGAGEPHLDAQVIIIGGGPAGSTVGAYLA